jgi:hypothetical protein
MHFILKQDIYIYIYIYYLSDKIVFIYFAYLFVIPAIYMCLQKYLILVLVLRFNSVSFVQPIILFFSNLMPLLVSFSALYFMLRKRLEQKGSRAVVFYYRKFPLRWYCICHACHNILKTKNKTHTMHGSSSFMLVQFLGYRD